MSPLSVKTHRADLIWPSQRLGEIAQCFVGIPSARTTAEGTGPKRASLLSVQNINDGQIVSPYKEIDDPGSSAQRYRVRPGDVLLTCRGTSFRSALASEAVNEFILTSSLIAIRPSTGLRGPVLLAFLQSQQGLAALRERVRGSTTTEVLTVKDVSDLLVPLPPLDTQEEITALAVATEQTYHLALKAAQRRRYLGHTIINQLLFGDVPSLGYSR